MKHYILILLLLSLAGCVDNYDLHHLKPPIVVVNVVPVTMDGSARDCMVILTDSTGHLYSFSDVRFIGLQKGDTLSK